MASIFRYIMVLAALPTLLAGCASSEKPCFELRKVPDWTIIANGDTNSVPMDESNAKAFEHIVWRSW